MGGNRLVTKEGLPNGASEFSEIEINFNNPNEPPSWDELGVEIGNQFGDGPYVITFPPQNIPNVPTSSWKAAVLIECGRLKGFRHIRSSDIPNTLPKKTP